MEPFFFDGWLGVLRTLVVGALAYGALVLFLRVSGNRTLSKMNAFDLVVTVALGSTLATVLLSKDVPLVEGMLGFLLLIALQFVVTWSSVRSGSFRRLIRAEPALLLQQGRMLDDALRVQRVTEAEVRAAIRAAGVGNVEEVEAVVLESDGSFSVVQRGTGGPSSSLQDVRRPDAP